MLLATDSIAPGAAKFAWRRTHPRNVYGVEFKCVLASGHKVHTNRQLCLAMSPWAFNFQDASPLGTCSRLHAKESPPTLRGLGSEGCQLVCAKRQSSEHLRRTRATDRTLASDWPAVCPRCLDMILGFPLGNAPWHAAKSIVFKNSPW